MVRACILKESSQRTSNLALKCLTKNLSLKAIQDQSESNSERGKEKHSSFEETGLTPLLAMTQSFEEQRLKAALSLQLRNVDRRHHNWATLFPKNLIPRLLLVLQLLQHNP